MLLVLNTNNRLGWKCLPGTKTIAYWARSWVTKKIKCRKWCPNFSKVEMHWQGAMTMATGDTLSIEAAKSANNDYLKFTKSSHQLSKLHLLGCIEQRLPHLSFSILSLYLYITSSSLSNCLSLSNSLLFFLTHTHTPSF